MIESAGPMMDSADAAAFFAELVMRSVLIGLGVGAIAIAVLPLITGLYVQLREPQAFVRERSAEVVRDYILHGRFRWVFSLGLALLILQVLV